MADAREAEVFRVLDLVLDAPTRERAEALDRACGDDEALRARVQAMLVADARTHRLLDAPPGGLLADTARTSGPLLDGRRIGPYGVLRELGRGGMGVVYLAERADVDIHVALKVVPPIGGASAAEARFEQERRTLANLEHSNIARFLDAGVEPDGIPWMAMEYVRGERIDRYCNRDGRSLDERLALFEKVCSAVAYAHKRLLVHRDIKASNVLVTADGEPKLLDFGIATLLASEDDPDGDLTGEHGHAMTPEYASPEQLRGERATTASDVYQLGLLLYQLLTGRCPAAPGGECLGSLARVAGIEPLPPSRLPEVRPLRRRLEGDLDTIVMTALRNDPEERYASAGELAADVRRYRERRPIEARPPTVLYRLSRLMARHKVATTLAAGLLVLISGSSVALALQARRVWLERDRTRAAAAVLQDIVRWADPTATGRDSLASLAVLRQATESVRRELPKAPEVWATVMVSLGDVYRNRGMADTALALWHEAVTALTAGGHTDDPVLVQALGSIGAEEVAAGRLDTGLPYLEDAAQRARAAPPERRSELAASLADLGFGRQVSGDAEGAEALYRDATDLLLTMPDSGGDELDRILVNRGYLASNRRADAEAESLFRLAVARRVARLGTQHTRTLNAKAALARTLVHLERLDDADVLSSEVLEARRRTLGQPHADLAEALDLRARVLAGRGDLDGARPLAVEAVDVYAAAVGRVRPQTAFVLLNLGDILVRAGAPSDAVAHHREAVDIYEETFGPDHPRTTGARVTLAYTELRLGNLDRAWAQSSRALLASEARGDAGADLLLPLRRHGEVLRAQGRCADAIPLLQRAGTIARDVAGDSSDEALAVAAELRGCGVG